MSRIQQQKRQAPDFDGGLPASDDAERMVLGCVLVGNADFSEVERAIDADDFSLEKHKRIFLRMKDLHARGAVIDPVTVAEELKRQRQLGSVDGLSYLASLDQGLPQIVSPQSYIGIVKEKAALRRIICHSDAIAKRALLEEDFAALAASGEEFFRKLQLDNGHKPEAPSIPMWPAPIREEGFHGVAGKLVRLIEPHSEADPSALLVQFLIGWGSLIGRGPYYRVEDDYHYTNEFVVICGDTSKARKGTSWGRIECVLGLIDGDWAEHCLLRGLGSGEALLDAFGSEEKRQLLLEGEFARLLAVLNREGSTISHNLRDLWDKGLASIRTRQNRLQVTGAHLSMIGHVTIEELRRRLSSIEMADGFANRILWICSRRSKELPRGGGSPDYAPLLRDLGEVTQFARRMGNTRVDFDCEAGELWDSIYSALSTPIPGLMGHLTARGEAHTPRLAMKYALLDGATKIRVEHLRAALAIWDYSAASARFIWGDALGDPVADEILKALRAAPDGLTRTNIRDLFGRNQCAEEIDRALGILTRLGLVRYLTEASGGPGRPGTRWYAT